MKQNSSKKNNNLETGFSLLTEITSLHLPYLFYHSFSVSPPLSSQVVASHQLSGPPFFFFTNLTDSNFRQQGKEEGKKFEKWMFLFPFIMFVCEGESKALKKLVERVNSDKRVSSPRVATKLTVFSIGDPF